MERFGLLKNRNCIVVGAGEIYHLQLSPTENDYVIAVDGGYHHLQRMGVKPDLLIGDFDSIVKIPNDENILRLPREKDDTDMLAALKVALEQGYRRFELYGGTGGRVEHTFANIQLLAFLSQNGAHALLYGRDWIMTALTNGEMHFDDTHKGFISVFSFSDTAAGVSLTGLKYLLDKAMLSNTFPIGISNEFIGRPSSISVKQGTVVIVYAA